MCGICGVLYLDPQARADVGLVDVMSQSLVHRGPDDAGVYVDGPVGLGSRRLKVIDLSPRAHQPMANDDASLWIVYNGEVYNFPEVREALVARGHRFRSKSDTEVALKAYEVYGEEFLRHLNGMFALAIWDGRLRVLLLARDRLGIKPLYYARLHDRLLFASEIKALLRDPALPREVGIRGLTNYFTYGHSVAPDTIFAAVRKLLPGHYAVASGAEFREICYWDADFGAKRPAVSEPMLVEGLRAQLERSVRRQMLADVPVGAFLSGGVDSSAVVAFMARAAGQPVRTFAVGFDGGRAYNELADAARVARHLGTEHRELSLREDDLLTCLDTLVYHYDEPFGDAAAFPTYLVARLAREHVTVCLTGEGGDEIFGGYRRYLAERYITPLLMLPPRLRRRTLPRLVDALPRLRRLKKLVASLGIDDPPQRYGQWLTVFNDEMRAALLADSYHALSQRIDACEVYRRYYRDDWDPVDRLLYMDLKTWLADGYLEKVDKATMAVSLEARVPLLDHELVELMAALPGQYKIGALHTKVLFKRALQGLLPDATLRKPKHGFAVPTDLWFRGRLKRFVAEVLFDERTRRRPYFNHAYVEQLFADHQRGRRVYSEQLWLLLNFELWHRRVLDSAPAAS
jgi:asparagine synthase (glutamine-hydrolysing)